ncbi:MAG: hypothetical protein PHE27_08875, partial [Alphaproteobacteria bacterium]|nr:hypothetical protein [Alphaproteobacteria bacterium]
MYSFQAYSKEVLSNAIGACEVEAKKFRRVEHKILTGAQPVSRNLVNWLFEAASQPTPWFYKPPTYIKDYYTEHHNDPRFTALFAAHAAFCKRDGLIFDYLERLVDFAEKDRSPYVRYQATDILGTASREPTVAKELYSTHASLGKRILSIAANDPDIACRKNAAAAAHMGLEAYKDVSPDVLEAAIKTGLNGPEDVKFWLCAYSDIPSILSEHPEKATPEMAQFLEAYVAGPIDKLKMALAVGKNICLPVLRYRLLPRIVPEKISDKINEGIDALVPETLARRTDMIVDAFVETYKDGTMRQFAAVMRGMMPFPFDNEKKAADFFEIAMSLHADHGRDDHRAYEAAKNIFENNPSAQPEMIDRLARLAAGYGTYRMEDEMLELLSFRKDLIPVFADCLADSIPETDKQRVGYFHSISENAMDALRVLIEKDQPIDRRSIAFSVIKNMQDDLDWGIQSELHRDPEFPPFSSSAKYHFSKKINLLSALCKNSSDAGVLCDARDLIVEIYKNCDTETREKESPGKLFTPYTMVPQSTYSAAKKINSSLVRLSTAARVNAAFRPAEIPSAHAA